MTLKELIEKSKSNDGSAQRLLFELTCDRLKGVAMRYVIDQSQSQDVLQEAYIRIFKKIKTFNYINDAAAFGWMCQIVGTEAIRHLKKSKRWNQISDDGYSAPSVAHSAAFDDELYKILLSLPDRQRIVFNMFAIEGYSHKEIAAQLDIAESSSRSILTRARTFLQQQLTKQDDYAKV